MTEKIEINKLSDGHVICPECGKEYQEGRGLGVHRRHAHGVLGTATSSVASRLKKMRKQPRSKGKLLVVNTPAEANGNPHPETVVHPFREMNYCYCCGADLVRGYYALKAAGVVK